MADYSAFGNLSNVYTNIYLHVQQINGNEYNNGGRKLLAYASVNLVENCGTLVNCDSFSHGRIVFTSSK